jgi:putative transposase
VNHFGPRIAATLRKRTPKPHTIWHLDEVYLKIDGRLVYLWRAVDAEGEVLDVLVQTRRNKRAALKLMRKLLKKYSFVPDKLVTDDLRSYGAAAGASHIWWGGSRGFAHLAGREAALSAIRRRVRSRKGCSRSPGSGFGRKPISSLTRLAFHEASNKMALNCESACTCCQAEATFSAPCGFIQRLTP